MIFRYFLFITFVIVSCKNQDKKASSKIVKLEEKITTTSKNYNVNFEPLSNYYKVYKKREIEEFYQSKINIKEFSGAFLVAKNGEIIFEDYQGFSNYSSEKKIDKNTPLHVASISKVLTATAILKLVEQNKITLDQSLNTIFENFPYEKITIRTLLNHRSGLPKYEYFADKHKVWSKTNTLTNQDVLSIISNKKVSLDFVPNTKFAYCNTNFAILALIIEKYSNLPFQEAMKTLIFEPLEMNNTFVLDFEKQKDTVSLSYKSTKEVIPYDHLDAVYGDKNIYTTAQDLLKFDVATYSDEFISKENKQEMFKGYSYEKKGIKNYGLGIRLTEWEDGKKIFFHNGWWHGSTAAYYTLRDETTTLIVISNKYTRRVYQIKRLSSLFGNYPYSLEEEAQELE